MHEQNIGQTMFLKNRQFFLVCFLIAILVVSVGGLCFFYAFMPTYVESRLIPQMGKALGFKKVVSHVRRVGLTGSDIGSLRIGDYENPALIVDSIQMDYTLSSLWKGRVKKVLLSGITLYCHLDNGRLAVRGIHSDCLFPQYASGEKQSEATSNTIPSIPLDVLEIRNAIIVWGQEGKDLGFPVDLRISIKEKEKNGLRCDLVMHVLGQQISAVAHVSPEENSVEIALDANGVQFAAFAPWAAMIPGLSIWGEGDLGGKARFGLDPWNVISASVSCEIRNGGMAYQGLVAQVGIAGPSGLVPGRIHFNGNGRKGALYVSGVSVQSPVPVALSDFRAILESSSDGLKATGQYFLQLESFEEQKAMPLAVQQPVRWKGEYSGALRENGSWGLTVKKSGLDESAPQDFVMAVGGAKISSQPFDVTVQAKGTGGQGSAEIKMDVPVVTVGTGEEACVSIPLVSLKGRLDFQPDACSGKINLKMPRTEGRVNSLKVFSPRMDVSGRFATNRDGKLNWGGSLRFENAQITDPGLEIEADDVKGDLFFAWPQKRKGAKGQILVRSFRWKDLPLGIVEGVVRQKGVGVVFAGKHENTLLPGLTMTFSGETQMASFGGQETKVSIEILPYKTESPIDLGRFHPSLEGLSLAGSMDVQGNWRFSSVGAEGALQGRFFDGRLEMEDDGNSISGLGIELSHFNPLFMRSAPLQQLFFENANFGGLAASNGEIGFQIESASSLSIEHGSFKWCGGTVHIGATYLSSDNEFFDLVLYCDRLKLAMILEQFSVATAQGEGTVNGRIPVRLGKGTIQFGDGFLFSTPGDGGTISLSGTEKLTEGIPPNTPQFAQLELAREALKDFSYKWAKVALDTEEDNLVLRMQLDGKPAKPLPFVYKKDLGSFVKMKDGSQRSIFQGIRLDVNFRLPLEKLLHYSDIFKNILEANE
jgi:hypothetical protein